MTGRTAIATAHWRRLDMQGTDRCTLSRLEHGWMLVGQAIWHDGGRDGCLNYDVRCDPDWNSLSADVAGDVGGQKLSLRLHRSDEGWHLNGEPQGDTAICVDLDLGFTPATKLLPLRRLDLRSGQSAFVSAAYLEQDIDAVSRLDQVYTKGADDLVRYSSPQFDAQLTVHPTGFITHYPDFWEGWVDV